MKRILISKMFVGSYNDDNIGHEIINFYQPDNYKDSFIYNAPHGKGKQVDDVVLVGKPEYYAYPVLAIALNVEKADNSLATEIKYGGKNLADIKFDNINENDKKIDISHVTYKVKKGNLKKLNKITYIVPASNKKFTPEEQKKRIKELEDKGYNVIVLENENPQHSCSYCECDQEYNKSLYDLIMDNKHYEELQLEKVDLSKKLTIDNDSFLHFIEKIHSEQVYTNMFYNVLKNDNGKHINEFVEFLLFAYRLETGVEYVIKPDDKFEIAKEKPTSGTKHKGRLDLLIYNKDYIIVIENKINSGLNGLFEEEEMQYTQIDTYKEFAERMRKENKDLLNAKILTFLFVPNYSSLVENKGTISYSQLYRYFSKKKTSIPDLYYNEFINGLKVHSLTRDEEINRRFLNTLSK